MKTIFKISKWIILVRRDIKILFQKAQKFPISIVDYNQTNTIIKSIDVALVPMSTFSIECALNEVPISLYLPTSKYEISPKVIIEADYFKFLTNILKPIICKGEKII